MPRTSKKLRQPSYCSSVSADWSITRRRRPASSSIIRKKSRRSSSDISSNSRTPVEARPLIAISGLRSSCAIFDAVSARSTSASAGVARFGSLQLAPATTSTRTAASATTASVRGAPGSAAALAVDAGRITYDVRPDDLGAFVESVAWAAPAGGHPMSVSSDRGIVVAFDRSRLEDVVESLVDNAAKFSPPDAPIEVRVHRDADEAVIDVVDRGPGIPLDKQRDVFERFAKWRPAGYEETPGAGLGLFLARTYVNGQGGRIEIVERDEGGTILRVSLPGGGTT